ncbi:MAG: CvpA family protein [Clostridia bacterium]|nr:CvpA family protein [Clostridia bacterium]
MGIYDWIFIAALILGLVLGIIKGFLKPLFSAIGFIVIAFGTAALAPTVQGWLVKPDGENSNFIPLLAIIIAFAALTIIWVIVSLILRKIITSHKGMGILNRIIGAVLGVLIVYLVFAVITAFVIQLDFVTITQKLAPEVEKSWIRNHIYTDKGNFFGNWVISSMVEKIKIGLGIGDSAEPTASLIGALLSVNG